MQDIHSIGGGGGRFFGGVGGVDRRLRPNSLHPNSNQSLNCPRCDSLNTKFCYYNNYNLSQPRHFCKSCRRYWTKGGVLRNVPVGGGCRKTKRSSNKSKRTSDEKKSNNNNNNNSRSSSESSSLTASTTAAAGSKPPPAAVASPSASTPATLLNNFPDSRFFSFPADHSTDGGVFAEIGSFTSMMTSANDHSFLGFNVGDISGAGYQRLHQENDGGTAARDEWPEHHQWDHHHQQQQKQKVEELSAGIFDRTAQMDLSGMESRGNNGGVGTLDWHGGGDQTMFDLTGAVDHAYWSQTQWPDNDHSLYLP